VIDHGTAIVGYQNPVREGCSFREFRIADAPKLGIGG
jgi:hypothetical protein